MACIVMKVQLNFHEDRLEKQEKDSYDVFRKIKCAWIGQKRPLLNKESPYHSSAGVGRKVMCNRTWISKAAAAKPQRTGIDVSLPIELDF